MQMFVCLSNEKLSRALNLHVSGFMSLSGCSKGSLRVSGLSLSLMPLLGFVGKMEPKILCLVSLGPPYVRITPQSSQSPTPVFVDGGHLGGENDI